MKLASVVLDIATQSLDAPYTYAVPDGLDPEPELGCAVVVPFGSRQAIGFVIGLTEESLDAGSGLLRPNSARSASIDPSRLKAIVQVVSRPYFDEEGAACAQFLAHRYIAPLASCVRLFTPPGGVPRLVKAGRTWHVEEPAVGKVDDRWVSLVVPPSGSPSFHPRKGAVKQAAILDALRQGELRVAELKAELGAVDASLKSLEAHGAVRIESRRRMRGAPVSAPSAYLPKPHLTSGQRTALAAIEAARRCGDGSVVVLDGVTGSGKTEVYLRAIESVLEEGRGACVLVPEISLTPQTVARFRGRFGDTVAVMHSRMSAGERFDQWDFIRTGSARVVVGARSALFAPLQNVGLYVIDEEHESSYKQDSAPRYHAREVAVWMARRSGAAVVLGSATPSIEALHACASEQGWNLAVLPERANGRPLPEVEVVDMAREFSSGNRSMFSQRLAAALAAELSVGRKAVLLLNQRGFAKFLLCRDCGFVPTCSSCSTSLTYHERGGFLLCHHCGHREALPAHCPECASPYLRKFGAGTQRVEDELLALVAGFGGRAAEATVVRMDADTTSGKGAHERLLERFAAADAAVLLGTQMIAKGLDFDDVTLVGVINADTTLRLPDYRAAERTFSLIEQVAGRAGRAELPGRVIVQTYDARALPIRAAAAHDRELFLEDELPKRRLLGYPPFTRLANVLVWGKDEAVVRETACALREAICGQVRDKGVGAWEVLPATPCVLAKLRGTYRWHILVKAPADADPSAVLESLFRSRKADQRVHVAADVDPLSLL